MASSAWRAWPKREKRGLRKNKCQEVGIQKCFFQWLAYYPNLRCVTFAIPNGAKRTPEEGAHQVALGLTAGIPDIFMGIPTSKYHGLFIEFKSSTGVLSEKQKTAIHNFNSKGYHCVICHSVTEAIDAVKEYLQGNLHV